jgi:Ca2+-binding RTX toxin-like protein
MRLRRVIGVALAALAVGAPAPASAATVHLEVGSIGLSQAVYSAGAGEQNQLTVTLDGQTLRVADPGATVVSGDHCEPVDEHTAECVPPPIASPFPGVPPPPDTFVRIGAMTVALGDMNDRLANTGRLPNVLLANGGPGDDVLHPTGSSNHQLDGGGGRDSLFGGESTDVLTDGDGSGASDPDHLDGGPGDDTVSYAHRSAGVTVDLGLGSGGEPGENDAIVGIEQVSGGAGSDRIRGTDGIDWVFGRGGDDVIEALGGNDLIEAGAGDDVVDGGAGDDSIDGESGLDVATCGEGEDTVFGTVKSELLELPCEYVGSVRREPVMPAHPTRVTRRAVWLEGRCVEDEDRGFLPCSGTFKLYKTTGRRRLLARAAFSLDAPRTVRLKLNRVGRRLIRRPRGVLADVSYRSTPRDGGWPGKADWAIRLRR